MPTIALTEQNFEETITGSDIVLIDFWASWCGPCRQFAPVYETVSEKNPDIAFAKVDTEAEQGLASAAQITSIPTIMIIREGIPVFAQPGALPQTALEDVIAQARALDMDEVKREVAQAQEQSPETPGTAATAGATEADTTPPPTDAPAPPTTVSPASTGRTDRPQQPERPSAPQRGQVPGVDFPDQNGAIV